MESLGVLVRKAWGQVSLGALLLFLLVQTIIWSLISISLFLVDSSGRLTHFYGARPWSRVLLWASRVTVSLRGAQHLAAGRERPLVLVSNHQSMFDILALLSRLPLDFKFVVKKELRKVPLWGYAMEKAGYLFIDREQSGGARQLISDGAAKMRGGSSMLFFAEGTRSPDGSLGAFKRGAFVLASRSGCDVVPLVVSGSRQIMAKKSLRIRPGHIVITVLPPISDPSLLKSSRRLMEAVRGAMLARLSEDEPQKLPA